MRLKATMTGLACVTLAAAVSLTAQAPQAPDAGGARQGGGGRGGGRGFGGPALTLSSPTVTDLQLLPAKYGCGATPNNVSPPLAWSNPPAATQSFAIVMLDADLRQNRTHLAPAHWYIWNIPASATSLPENVPAVAELPDGSRQTVTAGRNGGAGTAYRSPCPPGAGIHHYSIEIYALDAKLDSLAPGASLTDLYAAMDSHIVGHQIMVVPFHQ